MSEAPDGPVLEMLRAIRAENAETRALLLDLVERTNRIEGLENKLAATVMKILLDSLLIQEPPEVPLANPLIPPSAGLDRMEESLNRIEQSLGLDRMP